MIPERILDDLRLVPGKKAKLQPGSLVSLPAAYWTGSRIVGSKVSFFSAS